MSLSLVKYPEQLVLSGNPVEVEIETPWLYVQFRRIHCRVMDEQGNVIGEDSLPWLEGVNSKFQISEYLKVDIIQDFNLSDLFVTGLQDTNAVRKFKIQYFQTYNLDGTEHDLLETSLFSALQGGLSRALLSFYAEKSWTFLSKFIQDEARFLSWQRVKNLQQTQIQFLYYFNTGYVDLKPEFKLYFDNNTTQIVTGSALGQTAYTLYSINVSYFSNNFAQYEIGKIITKFDAYILGDGGGGFSQVSETKTYEINTNYYHHARQFFFKNSLGAFDYIILSGLSEVENNLNRTIGITDDGINKIFFSNYDSEKVTNSGFINERYPDAQKAQDYFTELLLSKEVYEVYKNHIVKVIPTSEKLQVYHDRDYLFSFDFKYKTAYNEEYYSDFLETPFLGVPGAAFRCQDADYNQVSDEFHLTVVRTDTFENSPGIGSVTVSIYGNSIHNVIRNVDLAVAGSVGLIVDLSAYSNITKIEWEGICNGAVYFGVLKESAGLNLNAGFEFKLYDESLTIEAITGYKGSGGVSIDSNKIIGSGVIYDMLITVSGIARQFIMSEGSGYTVVCVKTGIKAIISNFGWTKQNTDHWNNNHGFTKVSDSNSSKFVDVPYDENKVKIYI